MELVPSVALRSVNISGSLGVIDRIGLHGIGSQCGPQECQPKWKFGCNISDWPSWNWFPVWPSGVST
jgi:hypothetical protein